jgi:hypothetical protein
VSAKIATKSNLRRSWYDYNWDWALILLLAFVLLAGIVVLRTYADPQTAAAVDLLALSWRRLMTTVLVVEDEILVRLAICEDLASEGYEALTADNADQAIEILESRNDITHPIERLGVLLQRLRILPQHFADADDGVQRSAELMTHIREEL